MELKNHPQLEYTIKGISRVAPIAKENEETVAIIIKGMSADLLSTYKHILETSLNDADRDLRIHSLCKKFGIAYTGKKFY